MARIRLPQILPGVSAICLAFLLTFGPALAQSGGNPPRCASHDDFLADWAKDYNERPTATGIAFTGAVLEVLESPNGSTWTIIVIGTNKFTCSVTHGTDWRQIGRKVRK